MRQLAMIVSLAVLMVCAAGLVNPDGASRPRPLARGQHPLGVVPIWNGAHVTHAVGQVAVEFEFLEVSPEDDAELRAASENRDATCRVLSSQLMRSWIEGRLAERRIARLANPCLVVTPGVEGDLFSGGEFRPDGESAGGDVAASALRFGTDVRVRAVSLQDGVHLKIMASQSCRVFREHSAADVQLVKGCQCAGAVDLPWNRSAIFDMAPDATLRSDAESSAHLARRTVLVVRAAAVQ